MGGERREGGGLGAVHRMGGLVGAGEVADREHGLQAGERGERVVELGRLEAEAVHAAVELHRDGEAGEVAGEVGDLAGAVEAGHEAWLRTRAASPGMRPAKT